MNARLSVGIESNCTAPLQLERVSLRLFKLMGVDSLLLPDHYLSFVPRPVWNPESTPAAKMVPSPDAFFDPFVMMGMMAARYRRVRIGTGVTEAFRRHPATLAQAFVTLDHLTGGRAILGIGNGERENTAPYGIPFTKRVKRLEEALTIIRRLWESRGEPVSFDGSFWRLDRALFTTPLHGGQPPAGCVAAQLAEARRQATPELFGDAIFAGSVDQVVSEVEPLVEAGLRHVVIWNIGPIANGASASDLVRLALLVRRLKRITIPVQRPAVPVPVEQPLRAPAYGARAARAG